MDNIRVKLFDKVLNVQSAKRGASVKVPREERNEPPKFGFPKIGTADHPFISLLRSSTEKNIAIDTLFKVFLVEGLGNMTG
jgi:hypothetical protein